MGEPLPGDIPDPIYLKTTNVSLTATQIVLRGDFIEAFDNNNWQAISTTDLRFINTKTVQAQEDQNSTGAAAGAIILAAFGTGSWVYAKIGEIMGAETPVRLAVFLDTTNQIGFMNSGTFAIEVSTVGTAIGEVTVVNTTDRGVQVGDQIVITGTVNYNFTYTVTDVSADGLTITMFSTASTSVAAEGVVGNIQVIVTKATATAMLIKVSGQTTMLAAAVGDIGVFALGMVT